jgi:hypothetical protein
MNQVSDRDNLVMEPVALEAATVLHCCHVKEGERALNHNCQRSHNGNILRTPHIALHCLALGLLPLLLGHFLDAAHLRHR